MKAAIMLTPDIAMMGDMLSEITTISFHIAGEPSSSGSMLSRPWQLTFLRRQLAEYKYFDIIRMCPRVSFPGGY